MTGPEKCSLFVATRRLGVVRHTPAAYIKLHGNGIYQLRICPRCAIWGQKPSRFKDPQLVNPKFYYVLACSLSVTVATAHTHRRLYVLDAIFLFTSHISLHYVQNKHPLTVSFISP